MRVPWLQATVLAPAVLLVTACSREAVTHTGFAQVNDARLYYEDAGQGPAVVMIHGGFLDARMWDPQFQAVAERYRAIRYDVRGHGRSAADSVAYADHEDLLALLDHLDVDSAVLVGLSLGGVVAIDFALTHPDRVSALVLVSPGLSGFDFNDDEMARYWREMGPAIESGNYAGWTAVFARWWCDGPHRQPADVDSTVRAQVLEMISGSEQRWRYWSLSRGIDPPAAGRLGEIHKPTLAVEGSLDMMVIHAVVDSVVAHVPGARRVVIPDAAHMLTMEKPEQFNEVLLDFLQYVTAGQTAGGNGGT